MLTKRRISRITFLLVASLHSLSLGALVIGIIWFTMIKYTGYKPEAFIIHNFFYGMRITKISYSKKFIYLYFKNFILYIL